MKILRIPFVWLAALFFLVEEFIWDQTSKLMAKLGSLPLVHALERHLEQLSPYPAMLAFLLPSLILVPAKLLGLHAIANGKLLLGGAIFVAAKLIGMALFSRIFNLTRPALMQLAWFAHLYQWVMVYRNRIHAYLEQWVALQLIKQAIKKLLARLKSNLT